ncbi:hypothetical protein ACFSQJ_17435 [Croceitalea marina]|uniref:Uncharacterized protein n=1 Tax=Croceitalea marina TaxID=1775166 RepID=A0ABW5N3P4_9FLAO
MEYKKLQSDNSPLLLTKYTFNTLLEAIVRHFKKSHAIENYKDFQLYGFGNYDSEKPNLKNDLELVLKDYVNGKYLYNKQRELVSGKPIVKISREYRDLFFNYLGYTGVYDFIEKEISSKDEHLKQITLLQNLSQNEEFYYVCYYYGEDKKMTKGQLTIHNNWKTFELTFVYLNSQNEPVFYDLFGTIKQENNFVHFDCKHFIQNKKIQGSKMIFYVGMASYSERPILIGAYSSFDKYDHSIAGKLMLVQMNSQQEMEQESKSVHFHPAICQELIKFRHIVPSRVPIQLSKISPQSPYASIFAKIPNDYKAIFSLENEQIELDFRIQKYHYNILSNIEDIELENDRVTIAGKGQILELHFDITGIFRLLKASLYIKNYELLSENKAGTGTFSGVDINNNPVSGAVRLLNIND